MSDPLHLALLYGSTREGRFCSTVADWLRTQLDRRNDYTIDAIDPALLDLPHRHGAVPSADLVNLQQRIWRADAFVVVVPEYNHGYPAALKFVIDSVQAHWQAKPVAFVAYGGHSGGVRAAEQLRQVFSGLHAVPIRDGVYFSQAWDRFDAAGRPHAADASERAARRMLDQLAWYGHALRQARAAWPYPAG
ncbi:NAD(P)H-dependent oxidoreductase [Pseudoxanthomonas sp. PXM02]|jgi:NAD(P)H-dependent FMN reductase|uniref:NADPH-dependent FMN reductase n=1 Tax=Pseudoxanthomonas sp. PXM02 TaxID=2769294 RepID=UPI00178158C3|nr:NAD(P)H-dependent oxidoreductase [Pseudoxanthomonas sp. PXM02]MBD9478793.1 NAD(P)H-dependent oxidoreductase [Pseudoxanthomonas sp. PXM02]